MCAPAVAAPCYKNRRPSPFAAFDLLLLPSTQLDHTTSILTHPSTSTSFFIPPGFYIPNYPTSSKCLPRSPIRSQPLAARPQLEKLPLRRRKLERRLPLPHLARRRSAERRGRRPTPATSTRVRLHRNCASSNHLLISDHWEPRLKPSKQILTRLSAVLKQVHPDTGISNRAMSILNSFVNGMS